MSLIGSILGLLFGAPPKTTTTTSSSSSTPTSTTSATTPTSTTTSPSTTGATPAPAPIDTTVTTPTSLGDALIVISSSPPSAPATSPSPANETSAANVSSATTDSASATTVATAPSSLPLQAPLDLDRRKEMAEAVQRTMQAKDLVRRIGESVQASPSPSGVKGEAPLERMDPAASSLAQLPSGGMSSVLAAYAANRADPTQGNTSTSRSAALARPAPAGGASRP